MWNAESGDAERERIHLDLPLQEAEAVTARKMTRVWAELPEPGVKKPRCRHKWLPVAMQIRWCSKCGTLRQEIWGEVQSPRSGAPLAKLMGYTYTRPSKTEKMT